MDAPDNADANTPDCTPRTIDRPLPEVAKSGFTHEEICIKFHTLLPLLICRPPADPGSTCRVCEALVQGLVMGAQSRVLKIQHVERKI